MKKLTLIALLGIASTLFFSCSKKGDTGPAGKDGKDGNANVVSSSITSSNWTFVSPSWEMTFSYPAITADIISKGAVLVYVQSTGASYFQIPYTFYPSASYSRTYTYACFTGGVKMFVTDSDLTQPTNPGSQTFKVVVISASSLTKNPNVNLDNYEEVKHAFNLKN